MPIYPYPTTPKHTPQHTELALFVPCQLEGDAATVGRGGIAASAAATGRAKNPKGARPTAWRTAAGPPDPLLGRDAQAWLCACNVGPVQGRACPAPAAEAWVAYPTGSAAYKMR